MSNKDLEFSAALDNEDQEQVNLSVDSFGDAMRVNLSVDAATDGKGNQTFPRQHIQFTSAEWDALVAEVEKARAARKIFNLPT